MSYKAHWPCQDLLLFPRFLTVWEEGVHSAVWLPLLHTYTHLHTPGLLLFTCQVKGLKSVTERDITRKQGTVGGRRWICSKSGLWKRGTGRKVEKERHNKVEGGVEWGSWSDERVKCHKCQVSRPHKDKLCIAPKVRAYTSAPVWWEKWVFGWGSIWEWVQCTIHTASQGQCSVAVQKTSVHLYIHLSINENKY